VIKFYSAALLNKLLRNPFRRKIDTQDYAQDASIFLFGEIGQNYTIRIIEISRYAYVSLHILL